MSSTAAPSKTLTAFRSTLFAIFFAIWTIFYCFVMLTSFLLPLLWRYRLVKFYIRGTLNSLHLLCGLKYRLTGCENIPSQPSIIFSKHQSTYENFVLIDAFPPSTYIAKRELLYVPFFGWGMAALQYITIDRKKGRQAMQQIISQARDRFARGLWVTIYPEGTRLPPGQSTEYKAGGARLAEATGRKILMVVHNSGEFWARRAFLIWPGTADFIIGPLYDPANKSSNQIRQDTQDWMEEAAQSIHVPHRFTRSKPQADPAK